MTPAEITGCWHFLTSDTRGPTHYFIRGGYDLAFGPEAIAQMNEGAMNVFRLEDLPMIEAQQAYLGDADLMDREPAVLPGDGAAIRARRHLARLIREEAASATSVTRPSGGVLTSEQQQHEVRSVR